MRRYALVTSSSGTLLSLPAYMPDNYWLEANFEPGELDDVFADYEAFTEHTSLGYSPRWPVAIIAGEDRAGWTLDDYVLPRLASGGYIGVEIDLSHKVMGRVPA